MKHRTQLKAIEHLAEVASAIDLLPDDAYIDFGPGPIFIERKVFNEMFHGQSATCDHWSGGLSIKVGDVRFCTIHDAPVSPTSKIVVGNEV